MLMTASEYRESLRAYRPVVYVDGRRIDSIADEAALAPGVRAIGLTYDYAHRADVAPLMTAVQNSTGKTVHRFTHIGMSAGDLLNKLEATRLVCQETGCAQRYLTYDAMNAIGQLSARLDDAGGSREQRDRFDAYLAEVQGRPIAGGGANKIVQGTRTPG